LFKAFGRALRMAVTLDARLGKVTPSTKGSL
jgi:imidazoleglycerol phosphate dehydratase HisB